MTWFSPLAVRSDDLRDYDDNCQEWALSGECTANPDYMLAYCQQSCAEIEDQTNNADVIDRNSFFELEALDIDKNPFHFSSLKGKITLIGNVASFCGFTESHYKSLIDLYEDLKDSGKFEILAFPCNQFGGQEPQTCSEIKRFAQSKGVEFRMMNKIDVNGMSLIFAYK